MSQRYSFLSPPDPALTPPPGIIPDFQDAFDLRPYYNVTASLGLVTTGLILILRLYTKIVIVKKCRGEDCTSCMFNSCEGNANLAVRHVHPWFCKYETYTRG